MPSTSVAHPAHLFGAMANSEMETFLGRAGLGLKSVAIVAGHLFRGDEMGAESQTRAARSIRAEAAAILTGRNVGDVFGALACGTDIVVAEAALDLNIPFHAVMPFPLSRFTELSVDIGDPVGSPGSWRKRFEDVLSRTASLTIVDDGMPLDRDLDGHFYYGFRFMAGQALLRAAELQTQCRLIAVSDGSDAAVNLAGTSRAVADWLAAGRLIDPIRYPFARRVPTGRSRGATSFRPVLFLWNAAGGHVDQDAWKSVLNRLGAFGKEFSVIALASRVGGEGVAIVAPSLEAALLFAEAGAGTEGTVEGRSLRIICDFGPVLGPDLKPAENRVGRLTAGSAMPGFPTGGPLATLRFTAQAIYEFGDRLDVRAVGRAEEIRDEGSHARRRSGLPVFRVRMRKGAP